MSERKVRVQLSKAYQVVEVEVDKIDNVDDFDLERKWAYNQAIEMLSHIPDEGFGGTKSVSKETYTKQEKPVQQYDAKPAQSFVTNADIKPSIRLSEKQKGIAVTRINKGEITLQAVNNCRDYDAFNSVVFNK